MDEESLFMDIHRHLVKQAKDGTGIDTEASLAELFEVSRYRVRRVLDKLEQLGVIERAQKKGVVILPPNPDLLAENIQSQLLVSRYDLREVTEARFRTEMDLLGLCMRRLTPVLLGQLESKLRQMQRCIEFHQAALKLHNEFHRLLIEASGNRILYGFAYSLLNLEDSLLSEQKHIDHEFVSSLATGDWQLCEALKAQDEQTAKDSLATILERETHYLASLELR